MQQTDPVTADGVSAQPAGVSAHRSDHVTEDVAARLREAGCVWAEDEAAQLLAASTGSDDLERRVSARVGGQPLEHIIGRVRFAGLELPSAPGIFVPRQRSRLLAEMAVAYVRNRSRPVVVELCAGVAPIAAVVQHRVPSAEVHAADLDRRACELARRTLRPPAAVHEGDLDLALPHTLRERCDLVMAVPPYVPDGAAPYLPREARDHEPPEALYGGADGLDVVRRLLAAAPALLCPDGRLLVELHRDQLPAARVVAADHGLQTQARPHRDGQTVVLIATLARVVGTKIR